MITDAEAFDDWLYNLMPEQAYYLSARMGWFAGIEYKGKQLDASEKSAMHYRELLLEAQQKLIIKDAIIAKWKEMYVHHMRVIAEQADIEDQGDFGEYVRTVFAYKPPLIL